MHLSAACKWAIANELLSTNPFAGMYLELAKPKYKLEEQANPFTYQERDRIIEAFQTHNAGKKGISYSYYTNFVKFLFYTGCRPSEAVGLRWKHINDDCTKIAFTLLLLGLVANLYHAKPLKPRKREIFRVPVLYKLYYYQLNLKLTTLKP